MYEYVKLAVNKNKLQANRAKIIVEDCAGIAPFPGSTDPNHRLIIIKNQRAEDPRTEILRSPVLHEVHFQMESFKMMNLNHLNLDCFAYVCAANDKTHRCNNPAANAKHTPILFPPPLASGSIRIWSPDYDIPDLNFKRRPIYDDLDLPGLAPDDEVRIGEDDNKFYLKRANGIIRLYHKPKTPARMRLSGKAGEECLKQF